MERHIPWWNWTNSIATHWNTLTPKQCEHRVQQNTRSVEHARPQGASIGEIILSLPFCTEQPACYYPECIRIWQSTCIITKSSNHWKMWLVTPAVSSFKNMVQLACVHYFHTCTYEPSCIKLWLRQKNYKFFHRQRQRWKTKNLA